MRTSIETNIFGLTLGTYLAVYFIFSFTPLALVSSKHIVLSAVIALFFPVISRKKQLFLTFLYPLNTLPYMPTLIKDTVYPMTKLLSSFVNYMVLILDSITGTKTTPYLYPHSLMLGTSVFFMYLIFIIEPFIFQYVYKKMGLYDKLPFRTHFMTSKASKLRRSSSRSEA